MIVIYIQIYFFFQVLQVELSALKHNQARVHELSSYLMLSDPDEIARVTRSHQGSKATDLQARLDLMHRLQVIILDCLNYIFFNFTKKKLFIFSCEIMIKNGNTNFCKKYSVKWFWSKFKKCVKLLNRMFAFMSLSFSFVTYLHDYIPTYFWDGMQIANIWNKEEKLFTTKNWCKKVWGKKFQLGVLLWKIQIAKIRFSLLSFSICTRKITLEVHYL